MADAPGFPEVVMQDELWVDGQRIEEMDWKHRANLIPFLRRSAEALQWAYAVRLADFCGPDEESAYAALGEHDGILDMQAEDWLERTPLMQKLVTLEAGRPIEQRAYLAARNKLHETLTGYEKITLVLPTRRDDAQD